MSGIDSIRMNDMVDTAVAGGAFKTLVVAVTAAGLVETLKGLGPFTIFAPSDEAFSKLPKKAVADLLKMENKGKLRAVLTYHVVAGKVLAADVLKVTTTTSVQGQELKIDTSVGVKVVGANVARADIACGNGVIQIIDSVMTPK